jgi:hypothetical protein
VGCCEDRPVMLYYFGDEIQWFCARHYDLMEEHYKRNALDNDCAYAWDVVKLNGW